MINLKPIALGKIVHYIYIYIAPRIEAGDVELPNRQPTLKT